MIIGIGLDVVEKDRIAKIWSKFKNRFAEKILTTEEIEALPQHPIPYLASRFAAKEAGVKALGTGFSQGIGFKDIMIKSSVQGKPELIYLGKAQEIAFNLQVKQIHISISYGPNMACAVVILEK